MKQNSNNINRRNFLRISAAAGAGAAFFPKDANASAIRSTSAGTAKIGQNIEMPVRTLGRTGLQIPLLSMGVMRADNPSVVRAAYNAGIKFFDTANGYQQGRNEEMLGTFFEDKPRDSFFIASKANLSYPLVENSISEFEERVETSLKRLKMSYVDIFYIHGPRTVEMLLDEKVIAAIKKVKDSGKARFIGFSTHANLPGQIDAAIKAGIYDVILLSYNFKLTILEELNPAIKRAAEAGIGFIAMKTMTGGVEDAEGKTKVNGQACLKWAWQNEHITTVIPGFTNYDLLDDCLAAVKSPALNEDEKKYLASLQNKEMLYCQQCGQCAGQCPEKLPIPDLMRAYMYAYGYKQAQLSKETLATLQFSDNPCNNCANGCKVNCPSGFNVRTKIAAIQPIRNVPDVFLS